LKYEKRARLDLSEKELRDELMSRGSDYDGLQLRHEKHTNSLKVIKEILSREGIELRVKERETYTKDDVTWSDAVLTAGGDGTFLYGASLVNDSSKPVIGINTDPARSEGVLCVRARKPFKQRSISHIMEQILRGNFDWTCRHRIKVTLDDVAIPYFALNEVFIGEKDPTRTAYYELLLDSGEREKQKSSGLVVYTGSGSSAWVHNIHRLLPYQVKKVLQLALQLDESKQTNLNELTEKGVVSKLILFLLLFVLLLLWGWCCC
jgi:NAD+ kinase